MTSTKEVMFSILLVTNFRVRIRIWIIWRHIRNLVLIFVAMISGYNQSVSRWRPDRIAKAKFSYLGLLLVDIVLKRRFEPISAKQISQATELKVMFFSIQPSRGIEAKVAGEVKQFSFTTIFLYTCSWNFCWTSLSKDGWRLINHSFY